MTTYLPYRANTYCSLGHLIDGQFADTYLQQAGLIFCRGSVRLAGIYRPDVGTVVDFGYTRDNAKAARIPRRLRVLSSFADPFTKITTVQIGCKLSMLQENREPEEVAKLRPREWFAVQYPGQNLTLKTLRFAVPPLLANTAAEQCLARLGITAAAALPLASVFTTDEFDLSQGYVEVLGKLLESEGYVGWLNENEQLQVRNLQDSSNSAGPVINNTNCFQLLPIGQGALPAETVQVQYQGWEFKRAANPAKDPEDPNDDPNKIDENNEEQELAVLSGWTSSISYGFPVLVSIPYTERATGDKKLYELSYVPVQESSTIFTDGKDVYSKTISWKPAIAAASSYAAQLLSVGLEPPGSRLANISETWKEYNEEGRQSSVSQRETINFLEFAASLNLEFVFSTSNGYQAVDIPEVNLIKQEIVTSYLYAVTGKGITINRRETARYQNWALTQHGQQAVSYGKDSLDTAGEVSAYLTSIYGPPDYNGTEINIDYASPQPKEEEKIGPELLAGQAYGQGPSKPEEKKKPGGTSSKVTKTATLEAQYGSVDAERIVTFSLPYSPDDYYSPISSGVWEVIRTRTAAKSLALNYGRIQNRLRLGNAQGVSLQMPVELLPTKPFDAIYLQADGLTGQYRANGMSWTFDQNGIMGQVDALFWLATGQTGTPGDIWFPMPPAVSVLPTTPAATVNGSPAPANSATLPGGWDPLAPDLTTLFNTTLPTGVAPVFPSTLNVEPGLEPFTETVALEAITRSVLSVVDVPFSLVPQSATADMVTHSLFVGLQVVLVKAPVTSLTLTSFAPAVYVPVVVSVPVATLTLTAYAPVVYTPVQVNVPLTALTLTAFAPTLNIVSVPLTTLTLTSFAPTVVGNVTDPEFANVSLLLSMEGANNSTTFTDLSNNAFTVSVFGDAKVVTTDGDFSSGALDLDGSGDYLTTPADPAFAFGTGDFTIECYLKADIVSSNDGVFSFGTNQLMLAIFSSDWYLGTEGSGGTNMGSATASTRQHVAVTRSGTTLRLFVDGVEKGSTSNSANLTNDFMNIGFYFSSDYPFDGRISWLRVTKGVARYTANFTPPTAPFPTS